MTGGAAAARGGRPRLVLVATGIALASTAAILVAAPRPADHQAMADLSVPAILGAGFIDGFNPCAFGVLILFATFALGLAARESLAGEGGPGAGAARVGAASRHVLGLGAFFVAGVLITYFLLGLGLLTVLASLTDFGGNHLPSRIAALIAVGLGLWMIRDLLLPDARWKLEAPHSLHGRMRDWARVTSPVALFGGGVLIGLCTVPCSGAVYLGVVALLSTSGTVGGRPGGLALYNLAYITPLVVLLVLASRPGLIRVLNRWHLEQRVGNEGRPRPGRARARLRHPPDRIAGLRRRGSSNPSSSQRVVSRRSSGPQLRPLNWEHETRAPRPLGAVSHARPAEPGTDGCLRRSGRRDHGRPRVPTPVDRRPGRRPAPDDLPPGRRRDAAQSGSSSRRRTSIDTSRRMERRRSSCRPSRRARCASPARWAAIVVRSSCDQTRTGRSSSEFAPWRSAGRDDPRRDRQRARAVRLTTSQRILARVYNSSADATPPSCTRTLGAARHEPIAH